ncbi:MAG: hypothetical protein A3H68_02370 [Candidatus Taylorbacteria bacterium RIFCSPLOWO2_02_FULL_46_40]|uniref:Uncharacterized protein n=1 Tax=Candidatus Taylorbacteria bacterium RIFCSPLOWO2_02_FULL_46_40 TaxID=1802329 RepID=A0A1G2NZD5_9BACT|nr:MAG: hypothetical protein A3H68_02370 [Candidatus Taylorbacteria bacterium RIFCSPLOWO2_02_FULL_46_40]
MEVAFVRHVRYYNHKRAKSENLFSFFASAVIVYPKVFAFPPLPGLHNKAELSRPSSIPVKAF